MIKTVQHCLAGALTNVRTVSKTIIDGMSADVEDIDKFFVAYVDAETVCVVVGKGGGSGVYWWCVL